MDSKIRLLLDAFPGSKLLMSVDDLTSQDLSIGQLARRRSEVNRAIKLCTGCGLRCGMDDEGWSPVPAAWSPFSAPRAVSSDPRTHPWAVLGEAPGQTEARTGQPFVGKSGKLLRAMITSADLVWGDGTRLNVVSCFPFSGHGKGRTIMQPGEDHIMACRGNLLSQLALLPSPYLILAGSVAVKAWRHDLKVSTIRGRVFTWNIPGIGGFYVMPVTHPAAVLRQPALKDHVLADLRRFSDMARGIVQPHDLHVNDCVICGGRGDQLDEDQVPYCNRHYGRYGGNWMLARERWVKPKERVKVGKKKTRELIDGEQTLGF